MLLKAVSNIDNEKLVIIHIIREIVKVKKKKKKLLNIIWGKY